MNDNVGPKDSPFPAAGWTGSQLAPAQTPQDFFATAAEIKRRLGHHSRVPVVRQSREDVAGRQRPICRTYKAPSNAVLLGHSSWLLRWAMCRPFCSAPTVPFALPTLGEAAAAGGL